MQSGVDNEGFGLLKNFDKRKFGMYPTVQTDL